MEPLLWAADACNRFIFDLPRNPERPVGIRCAIHRLMKCARTPARQARSKGE